MLTIKTEEDKTDIYSFLSSLGVSAELNDSIVMAARDDGKILAVGALSMKKYRVFTDFIVLNPECADDLNISIGLMKSLLNLADLRGIKTVYGSNRALFNLYEMLRFKKSLDKDGEMYELSLEGYFTCEHKQK